MRRHITLAILGVVVATLVLTVAGSVFLVRRSAVSTAQSELVGQAQPLGQLLSTHVAKTDQKLIAVLQKVGSYQFIGTVALSPSGQFQGLPPPLTPQAVDASALSDGQTVSGNVGDVVFAAVPISLGPRELISRGIPLDDSAVLVITRVVSNPVNGWPYFLLVAAAVLVVGVVLAALLARRISAPLVRAVGTTRRIASGDLDARVVPGRSEDPELVELAEAINSLGESLARARGLERQFLLSVSHELRTPLTSIQGYADAIADGATGDVVSAAGVITSESRRLARLVQDLLDLARLDARQFSLHPQSVDITAVTRSVFEGFMPEATTLGIELVSSIPGQEDIRVSADPDRLSQIVANLIENAFKFAARRVEVGAARVGSAVALWVGDDGPGIAEEDLSRVFDRHFRSDRVAARRVGSGLGLAIVSELARAMDATVTVESPLAGGRGTRMVMWMKPVAVPEEVASGSAPRPVVRAQETSGSSNTSAVTAGRPSAPGD